MKYLVPLWIAALLVSFSSCLQIPEVEEQPETSDPNSRLEVPAGFDFSTTYEQKLNLVAIDENGAPMSRIQYFVFSAPPEEGGVLLHRGLTDRNGIYHASLTLPTAKEALYVYTPYLDLVRGQRIEVDGSPVTYEWGLNPLPEPGEVYKTAIDTTFGCDPSFYQVITNYLKKLDVISGTYMTLGAASSNYNGMGYNVEDGMIYGFKKIDNSTINLWRLNPNGVETDLGQIATPSTNYVGGNYKGDFDLEGNLYSINGLKLGRLNVDSLPLTAYEITLTNLNGASTNVHDIAYNETFDKFYTVTKDGHLNVIDHNAATIEDLGDYGSITGTGSAFGAVWCISSGEVFFSQNSTGKIFLATLDESGDPVSVELQLVGESTGNNDGAGCVQAESPFNDLDQDGIPNGNDDYPEDGEVAFATYTPDQISYGSYAFEDFWPNKGDYDFNDLVVGYNYEVAHDTAGQAVWLIMNLRLKALGAGFKSGFGMSLDDLLPSQIESVTGTSTSGISVEANGCESGQTNAVVIIFDNAHQEFGVPVGHFVNSGQEGTAEKDPVDFSIKVTFSEPIEEVGTFNPFIFTRDERGREIHLMNYAPTDLVDETLFGTEDDVSSGQNYYVDTWGFPWALDLPTEFSYPTEKTSIRSSYSEFDGWVRSSGTTLTSWYQPAKATIGRVMLIR